MRASRFAADEQRKRSALVGSRALRSRTRAYRLNLVDSAARAHRASDASQIIVAQQTRRHWQEFLFLVLDVARIANCQSFDADHCPEPITAPFGGFNQHRTGYVDLPLLMGELRGWLRQHQHLVEHVLEPTEVEPGKNTVSVAGVRAQRLVFCDGARLRANPWFDDLPLAPEKGEILNLKTGDWQPHHIINGAYWLVPLENGEVRFGATHRHSQIDNRITEAGRTELVDAFHSLHPGLPHVHVVRQQAGIRPGTVDRYPLIGQHPAHPCLWVFNGFGARGALVIPWYAQRLADHLQHGTALPAEADIRRFS